MSDSLVGASDASCAATTIIDKRSGGNGTKVTAVLSVVIAALLGVWGIIANYIEPLEEKTKAFSIRIDSFESRITNDIKSNSFELSKFSTDLATICGKFKEIEIQFVALKELLLQDINHMDSQIIGNEKRLEKYLNIESDIGKIEEQLRALEREIFDRKNSNIQSFLPIQ